MRRSAAVLGGLAALLSVISWGAIWTSFTTRAGLQRDNGSPHALRLARLGNYLIITETVMGFTFGLVTAIVVRRFWLTLVEERQQAQHDALHDALTGLPNRVLLNDRFEQALRESVRRSTQTGLLLVDLDRFKEINDTFGHHFGDDVLTQVATHMSSVLRDSDTVARLGGDEFAILLPDIDTVTTASAVAQKLRAALETPIRVEGIDLNVEASIGIVLSGEHGEDAKTLMQRADIAMYVAKTKKLGEFIYDADVDGTSPTRLVLLGELRRALEANELNLHYQPKISLKTGEIVGVEALIRWQHPTRGLLYPGSFIPVAEHTGLIAPLTSYLLDAALAQASRWIDAGNAIPIAINLSARDLLDEKLFHAVVDRLSHHDVPAGLLELEVTESAIITDPRRAQVLLQRLADLGIRIAIDDFGAGYTSLGQLDTLPVNELKVDRSYVATMVTNPHNAVIVRTIIELGHNIGLTIVAEGVEDVQTLNVLQGLRCDTAQGFYFARPMAADQLLAFRQQYVGQPSVL